MPPAAVTEQESLSARAISVALQHPAVSETPGTVCSIACTCRAWRKTAQQSAAGVTAVYLWQPSLVTVSSFAGWLAKYAGLVGSIEVDCAAECGELYDVVEEINTHCAAVDTMLSLSIMAAASTNSSATAAGRPLLHLKSFCGKTICCSAIVAALPLAGITRLQLTKPLDANLSSVARAIAGLVLLQELDISGCQMDNRVLQRLGHLGHLTSLRLSSLRPVCDLQLLPDHLQYLYVQLKGALPGTRAVVSLQHLSGLRSLILKVETHLGKGCSLPTQLQDLTVTCHLDGVIRPLGLTRLSKLEQLHLGPTVDGPEELRELRAMPGLQQLTLRYGDNQQGNLSQVTVCAPEWQTLQQLRHLGFEGMTLPVRCALAIGNCTRLTRLDFLAVRPVGILGNYEWCLHLASCKQLQHLILDVGDFGGYKSRDALHLTALTNLTHLDFGDGWKAVDDVVAVAICCSLTQLRHLCMPKCGLRSPAVSPALASLRQLQHLRLNGNLLEGWDRECKLMLSSLTKLTCFEVGLSYGCDPAWDEVRISIEQQQRALPWAAPSRLE